MIGSQMTRVTVSIRLWHNPRPAPGEGVTPTIVSVITGGRTMPRSLLLARVLDEEEPAWEGRLDVPAGEDHLYVFASGGPTVTVVMVRTAEGTRPAEQIDRNPPCWRLL